MHAQLQSTDDADRSGVRSEWKKFSARGVPSRVILLWVPWCTLCVCAIFIRESLWLYINALVFVFPQVGKARADVFLPYHSPQVDSLSTLTRQHKSCIQLIMSCHKDLCCAVLCCVTPWHTLLHSVITFCISNGHKCILRMSYATLLFMCYGKYLLPWSRVWLCLWVSVHFCQQALNLWETWKRRLDFGFS